MDNPQIIQPNNPEPKKNWFASHMIVGYVFLFAVLAAAVSGIYYWQTVRQIPTSYQAIVHKDPTAGWQTYTNSQYGFEFKYPNQWTLKENDGTIVSFLQNNELIGYVEYDANFQSTISSISPDNNKKIDDQFQLNMLAAKLGTTVAGDLTGDPPWVYNIVYIKNINKDTGISIWLIVNHDPPEYKVSDASISAFNQILSTFKFTR